MTRTEIIAALDNAEGPSRNLDAEIDCLVRFKALRPARQDDHIEHQRDIPPQPGDIWTQTGFLVAEHYTSSIDSALSLVPEGLGHGAFSLSVNRFGDSSCTVWTNTEFNRYVNSGPTGRGPKRTPAITLCIAALKARGE